MSLNTENNNIKPSVPEELQDIAPYDDSNFHEKMAELVEQEGFKFAINFAMPDVNYDEFKQQLLNAPSQDYFQRVIAGAFLERLAKFTTDGITLSGIENYDGATSYTFISNHRDIVLDASFLNLCFIREKMPLTQIAIGNNLLIYDWITDLVKINRSFIVKRDMPKLQAVEAARQLSAYIHYAINQRHEPVWIAQRQGRAKDSNDVTQESLIKMLSFEGGEDTLGNILSLNICPTSISYEFDPNDFLKVKEFLMKRRDPEFKKSQRDDLLSMEIGMFKPKGHVHFNLGRCINDELKKTTETGRNQIIHYACQLIDREIHLGYKIYPCNYISCDKLNGAPRFADKYTDEDVQSFDNYITDQLAKVDVADITDEEYRYMKEMMLTMYAFPLKNQLAAKEL